MPTPIKIRRDYGITRVDQPEKSIHGFYVRVCGNTKFFSDGVYKSKRLARESAENFRDQLFRGLTPQQQARANKLRVRRK